MAKFDLPYFDRLIASFGDTTDPVTETAAIYRNLHWGYFDQDVVNPTADDYVTASTRLTHLVCSYARVASDQRIMDVGCGFGGTLGHLNDMLAQCDLVGINIDERQLAHAAAWLRGQNGNQVSLVAADACRLPFASTAFDAVLAVESIFHFTSRRDFLVEAARLLAGGGTVVLSDFVLDPRGVRREQAALARLEPVLERDFGAAPGGLISLSQYWRIVRLAGLRLRDALDITARTLPTYPLLRRYCRENSWAEGGAAVAALEELTRLGVLQYQVLVLSH